MLADARRGTERQAEALTCLLKHGLMCDRMPLENLKEWIFACLLGDRKELIYGRLRCLMLTVAANCSRYHTDCAVRRNEFQPYDICINHDSEQPMLMRPNWYITIST